MAREAIGTYLKSRTAITPPPDTPEKLKEKSGVFVTLNNPRLREKLRGCIGFPLPMEPLARATIESAIDAATNDPRFEPVTLKELENEIAIEVSVLTPPEEIKVRDPSDYPRQIRIGRDGLIVERGARRGLLLPQVAVDWDWDAEEFLSNCCMKAGLPPDAWLIKGTKVQRFEAIIFGEEEPHGRVTMRELRGR